MRLLTFLGVGNYQETIYFWHDNEYRGRFAPAAACHFLKPSSVTVFLTEDAQQKVYNEFLSALPADLPVTPEAIPLGSNQTELWQIFQQVSAAAKVGEEVAFDITHGLRSFPLVGLLVAAFLRSAQRVQLKHVLYGAFDVRDQTVTPHRTPIFDLSPMLTLLDWSAAADQFALTGDARRLADLLKQSDQPTPAAIEAANTLSEVSQAAILGQSIKLAKLAGRLEPDLRRAQEELHNTAMPFDLLRERVTSTFRNFTADIKVDLKQALQAQFRMVVWYHANNQLMQAMTLAREWHINAVIYRLNKPFTLVVNERENEYARAITGIAIRRRSHGTTQVDLNEVAQFIEANWSEDEIKVLVELSNGLNLVRNALAHAGHEQGAMNIKKIIKKADTDVMIPLTQLAIRWGLT